MDCQPVYSSQGIVQKVLNQADAVCTAISDVQATIACTGSVASIAACITGVGAVLCGGGLTLFGPDCLKFLVGTIAQHYTKDPSLKIGLNLLDIGIEGAGPSAVVSLTCDAIALAAAGTGTSGTQITISPQNPTMILGATTQFSSMVTGKSENVTWSVDSLPQGTGSFAGAITATGLYTAPSSLPNPSRITILATSAVDSTATAGTVVTRVANPPGTIITVAGNNTAGYSGDGAAATSAELRLPSGIAFDGAGNMFIADSGNNVIRRVDAATGEITTIAGNGIGGYSGDGNTATGAELNYPSHVVFDRTVNLYITDANNQRIRRVDAQTDAITTIAGNGIPGFLGDNGPATNAELNFPDGVALDTDGNLFIGDARNNRIREVTIDTGTITTVAGSGVAGYSGDGGPATRANLNFPARPFVDTAGNIYIADYQNNRIRRVDATTRIITTVAGTGIAGYSGDGASAISAQLNGPLSVAADASGNLYIADTNNERIRAVNTGTKPVALLGVIIQPGQIDTVVGTGTRGYAINGGPATSAEIDLPTGLIINSSGNLFFADAHNNVVRRVTGQ